ncbi:hypothetical protein C8N35_102139 [Breoghania corrubedonensis]|uniref:Uncharacterized protein n=1 Tax=Breoghania corrubedonensis TaxID=665038 RepID=A0A2T5VCE5_9HYPH|nr:phage tail tube protein [Breoghania corrubedonensis]PTW61430.1 hypothetical protein C8N35_102139 [Breoghania corrubedonensis]
MARRFWRKLAMLAKLETTYGTDATPTAAMQISNVQFDPMQGEEVSRDLLLPYLGHQGVVLAGIYAQLQFDVEIAGSGAAGTAPGFGPLLRSCGLAETITTDTSVAYDPVSSGQESSSLYFNMDGVRHVILGARGNVQLNFAPKQIPHFRFNMMGLLGTITDAALPAADLSAFVTPLVVNKVNTTLSLHGTAQVGESLAIDLGNQVEARFLIGDESIEIPDRKATGTAVVEAKTLATNDWFAIATARTRGALALAHGTVGGNIVQVAAPAVEIGRPSTGQTQGITNYSLPLMLCPDTGDDELALTFL